MTVDSLLEQLQKLKVHVDTHLKLAAKELHIDKVESPTLDMINNFFDSFVEFKNTHIIVSEDKFEERYEKVLAIERQLKELGVELQDCVIIEKQKLKALFVNRPTISHMGVAPNAEEYEEFLSKVEKELFGLKEQNQKKELLKQEKHP